MPANCTAHQPPHHQYLTALVHPYNAGAWHPNQHSPWGLYRQPCALDTLLPLLHSVKGINQPKPKTPIALQSWHRARLYAIADTLHKNPSICYALGRCQTPWLSVSLLICLDILAVFCMERLCASLYAVWALYLYPCCLLAGMVYATSAVPVTFVIAVMYAVPETAAIPCISIHFVIF